MKRLFLLLSFLFLAGCTQGGYHNSSYLVSEAEDTAYEHEEAKDVD